MSESATSPKLADGREAFEAWARPRGFALKWIVDGYQNLKTHDAWMLWQAARAQDTEILCETLEALSAMKVMMERGGKPEKLDAALTWRQNDEKAHGMAEAAITKLEKRLSK